MKAQYGLVVTHNAGKGNTRLMLLYRGRAVHGEWFAIVINRGSGLYGRENNLIPIQHVEHADGYGWAEPE